MKQIDQQIRIGAAARMLEISPSTLRYWELTGKLVAVRIGGQRFYSRTTIEALAAERRGQREQQGVAVGA